MTTSRKLLGHLLFGFVLGLASTTTTTLAQSAPPAPAPSPAPPAAPPPYSQIRWNEDYSYLKDPSKRTDPLDSIKYIPVGGSGDSYLTLGGQVRYRYEWYNNTTFGAGFEDNDGYHLIRLLAYGDFHLNQNFRFFVMGKSAMIEDGGIGPNGAPRASDADELDLQQAFADFILPLSSGSKDSFTFRFGRQEMVYGLQRVIGVSDWGNALRTFDGAKVSLVTGRNTADLFWVRPVDIEKEEFNNGDPNTSFAGIYDTLAFPDLIREKDNSKLEMYGLALNRTNARFAQNATGAAEDEDRYTIGARFSSTPKPFDIDLEGAYQFGKFGSGDINAWMFAAVAGYTFDCQYKPRLYLGFDIASGDDNPANADLQTFNQLFPSQHSFFGYADVIGRQNIIDLHPGIELLLSENHRYAKKVTFLTEYHSFWRENTNDALYSIGAGAAQSPSAAGITRGAGGSDSAYVGGEIDLMLNWQFDRHLSGYIGYSHFFAGDFIHDTAGPGGFDHDIDFAYVAMMYTF